MENMRRLFSVLLCLSFCPAALYAQAKPAVSYLKALTQRGAACARCTRYAGAAFRALPPASAEQLARSVKAAEAGQTVFFLHPAFLKSNTLPGGDALQAAVFDLDGTLLDSLYAWKTSSSDFLRSKGITPPPGIDEKMAKLSLLDGAAYLKKQYRLPDTPQQIVDQVVANVGKKYVTEIRLKPGARELLQTLKARGVKLAVATASDRKLAEAALRREGVLDWFDFMITCDEAGAGKTSPLVYEKALKRLGTPKAATWVFEDALHALETAKRAGFPVAAVEDPASLPHRAELFKRADRYITSFSRCRLEE